MKISFIECLVIMTVAFILSALLYAAFTGSYKTNEAMDYLNPQVSRAMSNRRMADELERANDLKAEELRLQREKGETP